MSFTELPSKVIESASTLTAEKIRVCGELLKLSYEKKVDLDTVVENYTHIFESLKDLTPPEQTAHFIKKHYKISSLLAILLFFLLILLPIIFVFEFPMYVKTLLQHFLY